MQPNPNRKFLEGVEACKRNNVFDIRAWRAKPSEERSEAIADLLEFAEEVVRSRGGFEEMQTPVRSEFPNPWK